MFFLLNGQRERVKKYVVSISCVFMVAGVSPLHGMLGRVGQAAGRVLPRIGSGIGSRISTTLARPAEGLVLTPASFVQARLAQNVEGLVARQVARPFRPWTEAAIKGPLTDQVALRVLEQDTPASQSFLEYLGTKLVSQKPVSTAALSATKQEVVSSQLLKQEGTPSQSFWGNVKNFLWGETPSSVPAPQTGDFLKKPGSFLSLPQAEGFLTKDALMREIKNLLKTDAGKELLDSILTEYKATDVGKRLWPEIEMSLRNSMQVRLQLVQEDLKRVGSVDMWSHQRNFAGKIVAESLPIPRSLVPRSDLRSTLQFTQPIEVAITPQETHLKLLPRLKIRAAQMTPFEEPVTSLMSFEDVPMQMVVSSPASPALKPFLKPSKALVPAASTPAQRLVPSVSSRVPAMPVRSALTPRVAPKVSMVPVSAQPSVRMVPAAPTPAPQLAPSVSSRVPAVPVRSALTPRVAPKVSMVPVSAQPSVRMVPAAPKIPAVTVPLQIPSIALVPATPTPAPQLAPSVSSRVPAVPVRSALTPAAQSTSLAIVPVKRAQGAPVFRISVPGAKPLFGRVPPDGEPIISSVLPRGTTPLLDPRNIVAVTELRRAMQPNAQAIVPASSSREGALPVTTAQEILAGAGARPLIEGYASVPMNDTEVKFLGDMLNSLGTIASSARGPLARITLPDRAVKKVMDLGKKYNLTLVWVSKDCLPVEFMVGSPSSLTDVQGGLIGISGGVSFNNTMPMLVSRNVLGQFGAMPANETLQVPSGSATCPTFLDILQKGKLLPSASEVSAPRKQLPSLPVKAPQPRVTPEPQVGIPMQQPLVPLPVILPTEVQASQLIMPQALPTQEPLAIAAPAFPVSAEIPVATEVPVAQQPLFSFSERYIERPIESMFSWVQRGAERIIAPEIQEWLAKHAQSVAEFKAKYPLFKVKARQTSSEKIVAREEARLLILEKVRSEETVERPLVAAWIKKGGPSFRLFSSPNVFLMERKMKSAQELFKNYNEILARKRAGSARAAASLDRVKETIYTVLGVDTNSAGIRQRLRGTIGEIERRLGSLVPVEVQEKLVQWRNLIASALQ